MQANTTSSRIATTEELKDFATPKDENGNPYDIALIQAAFEMVKPEKNWKGPIFATVAATIGEIGLIKTAIGFYVGGPTHVFVISEAKNLRGELILTVRFENAGYYTNIGA